MINLYTKYKSTSEWENQEDNHNKVLVALATSLKQELAKNKKTPVNPNISATNNPATETANSTSPPA